MKLHIDICFSVVAYFSVMALVDFEDDILSLMGLEI
jgi:multidrug efflux pump subunit AcrB